MKQMTKLWGWFGIVGVGLALIQAPAFAGCKADSFTGKDGKLHCCGAHCPSKFALVDTDLKAPTRVFCQGGPRGSVQFTLELTPSEENPRQGLASMDGFSGSFTSDDAPEGTRLAGYRELNVVVTTLKRSFITLSFFTGNFPHEESVIGNVIFFAHAEFGRSDGEGNTIIDREIGGMSCSVL